MTYRQITSEERYTIAALRRRVIQHPNTTACVGYGEVGSGCADPDVASPAKQLEPERDQAHIRRTPYEAILDRLS